MNSSYKGFTLAEVLIALVLVGVLAAFTIPKILTASKEQEKVAKIREVVATLEGSYYSLKASNTLDDQRTLWANLKTNVNLIDGSEVDPMPDGSLCKNAWAAPPNGGSPIGWFVFPNGVHLSGLVSGAINDATNLVPANRMPLLLICIDTNGAAPPNEEGKDVFFGNYRYNGDFGAGASAKVFKWNAPILNFPNVGGIRCAANTCEAGKLLTQ